ncbi:MAG TPA: NAD(P)-dependent alcohol dehydrogenase [Actinomycetota bacterium]|nr:NAD(P)-dependent alcohol dehydrogenase [Actinomycetota bacterium]
MKALVHDRFGSTDVLEIRDIEPPVPTANTVLVRVVASSVNPADWYSMTGRPYIARPMVGLRKPKDIRLGTDFAGTVESTGPGVTEFNPGDEVYGMRTGALAEFITISETRLALKPANLSFEEAAAIPVAAVTALQALRDHGKVQHGQHVLINGASGGVGTFTVQIAKALGAEVTGVCSSRNVDLVRSLGADHVVDYTKQDFTSGGGPYDLMIDNTGSKPFSKFRKVLSAGATIVLVGGPKKSRLLGPLTHIVRTRAAAARKSQDVVFFIAKVDKNDLNQLSELMEEGTVKAVIDRTYTLNDAREAFEYLGEGHAKGKVIVRI